jgi:hypothetical protein
MELAATTDPKLLGVLAELRCREPIFHRPELGTTREDFEGMTTADFWEVGASGRRYTRKYVLDALEERHRSPVEEVWETTDFRCQELAADVFLLTYTLRQPEQSGGNPEKRQRRDAGQQGGRITRRATIWRRSGDGWKIVFHQGTIVQSP